METASAGGRPGGDRPLRGIFRDRLLLDRLHRDLGRSNEPEPDDEFAPGGTRMVSPGQEQVWFFDALSPGTGVSNLPLVARISGRLDTSALRAVIEAVAARHEALRFGFSLIDEQLVAVPAAQPDGTFSEVDLRGRAEGERQTVARDLLVAEAGEPFDLFRGPLWRCVVIRTDDDRYLFALVVHHIAVDGYSLLVLQRELVEAYRQAIHGGKITFGSMPMGYYTLAGRSRRRAKQGGDLAYWKAVLADAPEPVEWPFARSRPVHPTYACDTVEFPISDQLAAAVLSYAAKARCTPLMVQLAAFAVMVHRYSGAEDFVLGMPSAGRTSQAEDEVVGYFVNMLALRLRFGSDVTGRELLNVVRESALEAYTHREAPFPDVLAEVQPERVPGVMPIFQMVFTSPPQLGTFDADGTSFAFEEWHSGQTLFDLEIQYPESTGGCVGFFKYRTELFDRDRIDLLAEQYVRVLECLISDPECPVAGIPLLTPAQRQAVLDANVGPEVVFEPVEGVHQLFESQADRSPEAIAVTAEDVQWTYRELDKRANQIANRLRALGCRRGSRVGLCFERSLELVAGLLGVLKAGGAYVPLDPGYPPARLDFMAADAEVLLVLTHEAAASKVPSDPKTLLDVADTRDEPTTRCAPASHSDDPAYVIYTSGTTGQPKGVVNSHRGVANVVRWMRSEYGLDSTDVVLQKAPYSFDVSVGEFLLPLVTGARLVLARTDGHKDPVYLHALINAEKVTTVHFVPSMLEVFMASVDVGACPSLRRIGCGGESLPTALARRLLATTNCDVHHLYGPTETAIDVCHWRCDPADEGPITPIGHPVANTSLYILDTHGEPVAAGMPGELYVGGTQVADGYVNRPELTGERFTTNPFHSGAMYRTGDLARRRPDGAIEFLGRTDRQVKLRGFRIEPAETEDCLVRSDAVRHAVVRLHKDPDGGVRLVAYVVLSDPAASPEPLREYLAERLPPYLIPDSIVPLAELPTTGNGKLDVRALPDPQPRLTAVAGDRPESATELRIAKVWQDVLAVGQVNKGDSFFALGGHSLRVVKVVLRVASELGVEIPLRTLFDNPVLADFAAAVDGLRANSGAKAYAVPVGSRPEGNIGDLLDGLPGLSEANGVKTTGTPRTGC